MGNELDIKLAKLASERRLIPFIGAGFSIPLGLPSWEELIRRLAPKLNWDPDVFMQSGNRNYLQMAEYFVSKKSKGELRREIEKDLRIDPAKLSSSKSHELLVKLNPHSIYTTNYDDGIEEAFKFYNLPHSVIRNINDMKTAESGATSIYKFHGDLNDDESLVITETNYFERLEFEDPLDIRLRSDILDNTLLFLGYSLNDINARYMFYKLSKINRKLKKHSDSCTAIMVTFGISDIQREILNSWGIEIKELDPSTKTQSVVEFLDKLTS